MSLSSVLKGPHFHRMELVKLIQHRSNLQYSVYLPYVSFWLASLCHLCHFAIAIAAAVAVDVGTVAVGCPYLSIASLAIQKATEIQVTPVV